jgi:hypothetical protein
MSDKSWVRAKIERNRWQQDLVVPVRELFTPSANRFDGSKRKKSFAAPDKLLDELSH